MYLISSLLYFLVFDLPPTNHGYIIFNGNPAVLVSVGPVYLTGGELQEIKIIPTSFKTKRYITVVGKERFELPKA